MWHCLKEREKKYITIFESRWCDDEESTKRGEKEGKEKIHDFQYLCDLEKKLALTNETNGLN